MAMKQRGRRPEDGHGGDATTTTTRMVDNMVGSSSSEEKKPRSLPLHKINWNVYMTSGTPAAILWVSVLVVVLVVSARDTTTTTHGSLRTTQIGVLFPRDIVFAAAAVADPSSVRRSLPEWSPGKHKEKRDFGGLVFTQWQKHGKTIPIDPNDEGKNEVRRRKILKAMDEEDSADDYQPFSARDDEDPECRLATWAAYSFPTCNAVHERVLDRTDDDGFAVSYLNSGSYRDAFRFRRSTSSSPAADHFVLKRQLVTRSVAAKDVFKIHREAIILERLSHSPRILDIYAHCGTSVFVEAMAGDVHKKIIPNYPEGGFVAQAELDRRGEGLFPRNNYTAPEKLRIAIEMAESLADLHGFEGGEIRHCDTHIEQWLLGEDGSLKLNDFNNAKEPEWNRRTNKYCTTSGTYGGTYRSPEEFRGHHQDGGVDVFALGNNIYTLLTGLWPFYDEEAQGMSHSAIRELVIQGKRPFVDPRYRSRSYIEGKLVEVMENTWTHKRSQRPTIFEVVSLLREIEEEARQQGRAS